MMAIQYWKFQTVKVKSDKSQKAIENIDNIGTRKKCLEELNTASSED